MEDRRIALALDAMTDREAFDLVERVARRLRLVKIGPELFTRYGPDLVGALREVGVEVFLDLKFHDIPTTVAGAVGAACDLGPSLLTVHASGGEAMLRAAVEACAGRPPRLLGVTVLTSAAGEDVARRVEDLARCALRAGLDGVVVSAAEAPRIRAIAGGDFLIVTPGIRPAASARHDQARVATPAEAVRSGADILVIGRAVTGAADPLAALASIEEEIARAR